MKGVKILVILILVLAISFLAVMQWKSDAIVRKAMALVQHQMEDSLQYESVELEWLSHFPSIALSLQGLSIGKQSAPFIQGGQLDIVLKVFPLINEQIIIRKLMLTDSEVHIKKNGSRWTYDLLKKSPVPSTEKASAEAESQGGWDAVINEIELDRVTIYYDDNDGQQFDLFVEQGSAEGNISSKLMDADLDLQITLNHFQGKAYALAGPITLDLSSQYIYDAAKSLHQFEKLLIENKGYRMEGNGLFKTNEEKWIDLHISWDDAEPQALLKLMPASTSERWKDYTIKGNLEGQMSAKGSYQNGKTPQVNISSELKNGSVQFPGNGGTLKNIVLDIAYDNGGSNPGNSYLRTNLRHGSIEGNDIKANLRMENLDRPVIHADIDGSLPASLFNLVVDPASLEFQGGVIDFKGFTIDKIDASGFSIKSVVNKSKGDLMVEDAKFRYGDDNIKIGEGQFRITDKRSIVVDAPSFAWNQVVCRDVRGQFTFDGADVIFSLEGDQSEGKVKAEGRMYDLEGSPKLSSTWTVKGIEIQKLLQSFSDFDQTFITSSNLKGKADVWAQTTIPYNSKGDIIMNGIQVECALEIKDGELRDMEILEDFGKYIHLDDLKDIRFNQFRNYLKIENSKVFVPVVFIQSSAINMSINGVHGFDQEILYNMKINAGQAAANKIKKADLLKRFKPARKSGWINLYYVLYGNTSDVQYDQDQKKVISSFEQSSRMKEELRKKLVDIFGQEVHWLEPNEWEDIPEYR